MKIKTLLYWMFHQKQILFELEPPDESLTKQPVG